MNVQEKLWLKKASIIKKSFNSAVKGIVDSYLIHMYVRRNKPGWQGIFDINFVPLNASKHIKILYCQTKRFTVTLCVCVCTYVCIWAYMCVCKIRNDTLLNYCHSLVHIPTTTQMCSWHIATCKSNTFMETMFPVTIYWHENESEIKLISSKPQGLDKV